MPVPAEKAVALFIRHRLNELFEIKPKETTRAKGNEVTPRDIAEQLGVAYPQVKAVLDRATGVGSQFETRFAEKYYRGSVDKLRKDAIVWCEESGALEDWTPFIAPEDQSVQKLLQWFDKTKGIKDCVAAHADVTVNDLLRYRAQPARHGETDPDEVYRHIVQLRASGGLALTSRARPVAARKLEAAIAVAHHGAMPPRTPKVQGATKKR